MKTLDVEFIRKEKLCWAKFRHQKIKQFIEQNGRKTGVSISDCSYGFSAKKLMISSFYTLNQGHMQSIHTEEDAKNVT